MSYPPDIHADSRCRLPLPVRDELDPATRPQFDLLADPGGGSIAGLQGPSAIHLRSARVSELLWALNRYLRFETGFGQRLCEIAILAVARECDSQFEWTNHEPVALREGVAPELIELIRDRGATTSLGERDAIVVELAREAFGERRVAPATYARALAGFGPKGLVDLIALMGHYAATAAMLAVFDMQLRPGQSPLLPITSCRTLEKGKEMP